MILLPQVSARFRGMTHNLTQLRFGRYMHKTHLIMLYKAGFMF